MFYIAIVTITLYAGLTMLEKLEKKDETKKAWEDGYEVIFDR